MGAGVGLLFATVIANIASQLHQKKEKERVFETLKKDYWLG